MVYAAPPLPRALVVGVRSSSLARLASAARGGLEAGEGFPERTSGIPLCPCCFLVLALRWFVCAYFFLGYGFGGVWGRGMDGVREVVWNGMAARSRNGERTAGARSGVVEPLETRGACVYHVAACEDGGTAGGAGGGVVGFETGITGFSGIVGFRHCGWLPLLR